MVYLDNSATTRPDSEVIHVMSDVMQKVYGNPSSLHGLGAKAERLIEQARRVVASAIHGSSQEIFFTSGGTESNNWAIQAAAKRGKHLITSEIEHPSVYEVMKSLEQQGWKVTYLPVDSTGRVTAEAVEDAVTQETALVSIMHVNNEVGSIQPIEEIGRRLQKYPKLLFHVDAVQSFGRLPINVSQIPIDMLTFSGHKFHGPKGIGGLFVRKNLQISPNLFGGGQEQGLRSGTENVPAIAGLAKAITLAKSRQNTFHRTWEKEKKGFIRKIQEKISDVIVNGDEGIPYIINLSFPGLKSEVIVHALEDKRVYVSSQSACASKKEAPSHVLLAMGRSEAEALSSIRISLGFLNDEEDLQRCAEALIQVVPKLQQVVKVR